MVFIKLLVKEMTIGGGYYVSVKRYGFDVGAFIGYAFGRWF